MTDPNPASVQEAVERLAGLHDRLAAPHPSLARGRVWCRSCGASQAVNSAGALRTGWPKCCGLTMTIDSPEERVALRRADTLTGGEG